MAGLYTAPSTKSQAYDHPAYEVPVAVPIAYGTLASGGIAKFAAWTSMILKACTLTVATAGTNTSTVSIIRVTAAGTATSTLAQVIIGTGIVVGTSISTAAGATVSMGLGTTVCAAGDIIGLYNGIDLTLGLAVGIEAYVQPGANLTV